MHLLLAWLSLSAWSAPIWQTPDFVALPPEPRQWTGQPTDCRAHIKDILCLVEPGTSMGETRPCEPGGQSYAPVFQTLYDQYPPAFQKMFCSLDQIFVEKKFIGTAYAGLDPVNRRAVIGIRQTALDQNLSLHQWSSWKEQLSFGGNPKGFILTPGLPIVSTFTPGPANDFLYFVIAHEFGHLFDFANRLNATQNCKPTSDGQVCEFRPGTWGRMSWLDSATPRPHNQFYRRGDLCFYWCEGKSIDSPSISRLYRELMGRSEFVSTYASTNYGDDWAEAVAYYALAQAGGRYWVDTTAGEFFNPVQKLWHPRFRRKLNFLRAFMRGPISYP